MNTLYFIAILPHKELQSEVTELKKYISANFHSKASLSSPPHITLYPPFKANTEIEKKITDSLSDFVSKQKQFEIVMNGFGCFKPKTIFIKPEENISLNKLQSDLLLHLKSTINLSDPRNEKPYHPHMTIATRDLEKSMFFQAWDEFRINEFYKRFEVNSLALLKHNGIYWEILEKFKFNS
jgi:2'-5' RNA ligase